MKKKLLASLIALALSGGVMAEDTSSSIRGKITTPTGAGAGNTEIIIVHEPSGTRKKISTGKDGTFSATGLRVGGPYKIIVDSDEFADQEYNDIYLQLGEVERLNAQLENADSNTLLVTGQRIPSTISNGSSTIFGTKAIANQSGISRDIKDVVRSNPLVSIGVGSSAPISIAGSNPRFNSFTVDGISQNDDFGLNGGGYPTQRSPIAIDALEQITVDTSPFDAKVSGFSGGLINAVLKSGTNEFHGSVFYQRLDSDWSGTPRLEGEDIDIAYQEDTWGFSVAGPIMKDKLFFALSYENYESPQTLEYGAGGSGAANETDATLADVAEVQRIAREVYGLTDEQIGDSTGTPIEVDEKYNIKLDWNISDTQRASFAYQYAKGNRTRNATSSEGELRLTSQWYDVDEELNNFTVKLYSDWNSKFATEMSVTVKDVANRQVSFGDFADVTINNLTNGGRIAFGSDQYRHANQLDTGSTQFKFDGTYLIDEHSIEFGVDYLNLSTQNLFVPGSKGVISFDSLADFENLFADRYQYTNGTGNDPFAVGADFDRQTLALYIQDIWDVNDDLSLTIGLRYEQLSSNDKPPYNANSEARTRYDNTANLDGVDILLPSVSFKYSASDALFVYGGLGRSTGGQPNVWISNAYSNNGVNEGFYRQSNDFITPDSILNIYGPAYDAIENASSDGNVSFTDPNFELPSNWNYQIGTNYQFGIDGLGDGFTWVTEATYTDKQDSAFWIDASLWDATTTLAADGQRILYTDNDNRYDLMLTNSDVNGKSLILLTTLQKDWDNGWSFLTSYTNMDITDVNPGNSSTSKSNYRYSAGINRNVPADQLGRSGYELEHRFVLNVGYNEEIVDGYQTNINLYFERRSGNPFTYATNFDRNLIDDVLSPGLNAGTYTSYIPTAGDANVVYTDPALEGQLLAAIEANGLAGYAGGYAPKNSATTPWVNKMDLSIKQEIPGFSKEHRGVLTFTIQNLLNLLDSSQGKVFDNRFGSARLYDVDSIDSQGRYVIDRVRNDGLRFNAYESSWKLLLGVRYEF